MQLGEGVWLLPRDQQMAESRTAARTPQPKEPSQDRQRHLEDVLPCAFHVHSYFAAVHGVLPLTRGVESVWRSKRPLIGAENDSGAVLASSVGIVEGNALHVDYPAGEAAYELTRVLWIHRKRIAICQAHRSRW